MYPEPLHTRFRLAPSGEVHVGHWMLAYLSQQAARVTGGTFTMRAQQLWATRDLGSWETYQTFAMRNFQDLMDLGIEPSHPDVFKSHGMSPSWRIQVTDDRGLADYYWHELGLDKIWGEWPVNPIMAHALQTEPTPTDAASWYQVYGGRKHPYMQFVQLVGEITTGRNCIIRGEDHRGDEGFADAMYPVIAKKHYGLTEIDRAGRYTPCQFFLPHIERSNGGKVSSSGDASAGFYAKDILSAGISPEKLFAYLGRILWGSQEKAEKALWNWSQQIPVDPAKMHLRPMPQAGARSIMEGIVAHPVIDCDDWARFLATGKVDR